jgi:hypothetical protein
VKSLLLTFCLASLGLFGSGSYVSRLPTPGMGLGFQAANDMDRYELGKALVSGRLQGAGTRSAEETRNLAALQNRLPPSAKRNVDLSKLQGLSPEQWAALRYYLELRYKIK